MARNKFKGTCYKCGLIVEAGTGHFERHNGTWGIQHALHPGDGRVTCKMAYKQTLAEYHTHSCENPPIRLDVT